MSTSRSPCAFLCPPRGRFGTALRPCRSSVVWRDAPSGQPALFSCMDARQRPPRGYCRLASIMQKKNKKPLFDLVALSKAMPDHHRFEPTWPLRWLLMQHSNPTKRSSSNEDRIRCPTVVKKGPFCACGYRNEDQNGLLFSPSPPFSLLTQHAPPQVGVHQAD